jgi:hypothetical protein
VQEPVQEPVQAVLAPVLAQVRQRPPVQHPHCPCRSYSRSGRAPAGRKNHQSFDSWSGRVRFSRRQPRWFRSREDCVHHATRYRTSRVCRTSASALRSCCYMSQPGAALHCRGVESCSRPVHRALEGHGSLHAGHVPNCSSLQI